MAAPPETIPFDEFERNLSAVFDRVVRDRASVVVEGKDGARAVLRPLQPASTRRSTRRRPNKAQVERSRAGTLAAAGAWKGLVDAEAFKAYIYERRHGPDRRRIRP